MRAAHLLAALSAILSGAPARDTTQFLGRGVGTLRRGQTKRETKPQWLQDRLVARAAEKRARKATRRLEGR